MEMLDTLLSVGVLGMMVSLTVEFAKGFKIPAKWSLLIIGLVLGIAYAAFDQFLPREMQDAVIMFITSALGTGMLFYEYFLKALRDGDE